MRYYYFDARPGNNAVAYFALEFRNVTTDKRIFSFLDVFKKTLARRAAFDGGARRGEYLF